MPMTLRTALAALGLVLAAGCAGVFNRPINLPLLGDANPVPVTGVSLGEGEVYVGLAFSGGGHRATAFAYGLLEELRATPTGSTNGLADEVQFVTGVSGGAVMATWLALKGPAGLAGFRERYLIRDGEVYMASDDFSAGVLARALTGGINARDTFGRWLDESLFRGATFADLSQSGIAASIIASDVASASAFVFAPETFDALCSDLMRLPLAEAVAASAAFPLVFAPFTIAGQRRDCGYVPPPWLRAALTDPGVAPATRAHALALARYGDPAQVRSVGLLDGGMTDSFGTTGFLAARLRAGNAIGPLTPEQAVRMRRMLFLVSNAATEGFTEFRQTMGPGGRVAAMSIYGLTQRMSEDGGGEIDMTLANRAIASATRNGYSTFRAALLLWRRELVAYRCALSDAEVAAILGSVEGWDCRDLRIDVGEVSFRNLPPDWRAAVNDVPTRLRLTGPEVDLTIAAGRLATRRTPAFGAFVRALDAATGADGDSP